MHQALHSIDNMKKQYLFLGFICFIISCHTDKSVHGRWVVFKSDYLPFKHISYCENLNLNSVFEFKSDSTLKVYTKESDSMNCNQEQSYTHRGNRVIITEYDMVFDYEILRNFHDTLVLRPSHVPSGMWDNLNSKAEMDSLSKNHFRIYLKKI